MRIHPSTSLRAGKPHEIELTELAISRGKRMIDILNPEPKVTEALTNIDLPSGVSIDACPVASVKRCGTGVKMM